ncbi:MAG: rhodanese-like domain-containing protein [Candidatus Lokiarchaeia archaeon]
MIFEKIKSEIIAHNSYFVGSGNQAAVIDPRRDIDAYLELADEHNVKITHIFETHRNEDYVIGSLELTNVVGAEIYHCDKLDFSYGNGVKNGDKFEIGMLKLEILETPGHTDESISITLKDRESSNEVYMVFTGDALFAGDVGRTDFFKDRMEETAAKLYDSIFNKLLPLGDGVIVCPAHGKGSVCGGAIGDLEYTTIGYEKKTNAALQLKNKEEFVSKRSKIELEMPPYFKKMEMYNKEGPPILYGLPHLKELNIAEVKEYQKKGAQIVDARMPTAFSGGHIPNSISIWRKGLPLFVGWMLNYEDPIIFITDLNRQLDEIVRYCIRLGYDNLLGVLAGGFSTWYKGAQKIGHVNTWTAHDLKQQHDDESFFILDVRDKNKWEQEGHIEGAHQIWVGELKERLGEVPKDKHIIVYCDSGYKTSIAVSILKMKGYDKVTNMLGGFMAWKNAGYPVEK